MTRCAKHDWAYVNRPGFVPIRVCECKRIQFRPAGKNWRNATAAELDVLGFLVVLELYAMLLRFVGLLKP